MLLQNATPILLQNATEVYYKMRQVFYYKMRQFNTKCNSYYKMRRLLQVATVQSTKKILFAVIHFHMLGLSKLRFLQTTKKIIDQIENGLKLNNVLNNHPASKKSHTNVFLIPATMLWPTADKRYPR